MDKLGIDEANKLLERKQRHVASVLKKRADYASRGLCITHGTKLFEWSKHMCDKCLAQNRARVKRNTKKRRNHE